LFWIKNGKEASKNSKQLAVNGTLYLKHRLIFMFYNGFMPSVVDHIDGNPLNNKIENLRAATTFQNQRNRPINKNNKSGHKNIVWLENQKKWRVRVISDKKIAFQQNFNNLELAQLVAIEARNKYHGEYANHG
jgi:hypothetical protein